MVQISNYIAEMIVLAGKVVEYVAAGLGLNPTDKQLHFWIFGIGGVILFVATDALFRWMARWTISVISFVYACTVLLVGALSLEVQQRATNTGRMDFYDVVAGMWGFMVLFAVYVLIRLIILAINKRLDRPGS